MLSQETARARSFDRRQRGERAAVRRQLLKSNQVPTRWYDVSWRRRGHVDRIPSARPASHTPAQA